MTKKPKKMLVARERYIDYNYCTVDYIIEELTRICKELGVQTKDVTYVINSGFDGHEETLKYASIETDDEYNKRQALVKKQIEIEVKNKEERRKQYEKLKKEFGE